MSDAMLQERAKGECTTNLQLSLSQNNIIGRKEDKKNDEEQEATKDINTMLSLSLSPRQNGMPFMKKNLDLQINSSNY